MQGIIVSRDAKTQQWSIANDDIQCLLELRPEGTHAKLTWTLIDRRNGKSRPFGPSGAPGVSYDGNPAQWSDDVDMQEIMHDDGSHELRIIGLADGGATRLTRSFQVFPHMPFVRLWGEVENCGAVPITVSASELLRLEFASPEQLTLFHVEQFSWVYRRDFFSQQQVPLVIGREPVEIRMGSFPSHFWGPTSCAWFALRDGAIDKPGAVPNSGTGLVAGIEFNGKSRLRAGTTQDRTLLVSMIDDLCHPVGPGERFEAPACFVGCFQGDWDEAGYVTQRFTEQYVSPPMPDESYPWVQYNSWRYEQDINEAQQLEAIQRCAAIGIEVAVIDLGWAVQIGEWRHNPSKFPRGLRPLAERARALGMRFGVHLALAQADVASPVASEHPDWLIHQDNDYFGAAPLCLGHQPCRDWLIGEILRIIDEYQLDYIVQDGEDMVKVCSSQAHTHAFGDSNYSNSAEGLDEVIAAIRRLRPSLVWENCEDGGCMMTYRMARLYHSSITVDNIATYATRQGIYGASYPFSPRYSVRYMQDDPTAYTLRSAIFGGPLILMHKLTEWNAEQMAETKAAIAKYKQLRGLVRDAKIIHLLPPRYNVEGVGWGWDAIQAVAPDQRTSVVLVYRAMGDGNRKKIQPRGLLPDVRYRVILEDRGEAHEMTGMALSHDGIELELPELASEMIRVEQLSDD